MSSRVRKLSSTVCACPVAVLLTLLLCAGLSLASAALGPATAYAQTADADLHEDELYVGREDLFNMVYWSTSPPATGVLAARLERLGEHVAVYVQKLRTVPAGTLDAIAQSFDESIYPQLTEALGSTPDPGIDGEHRVTVLLYSFGDSGTKGFFNSADIDPVSPETPSNRREMIYADLDEALLRPEEIPGIMAHELSHLIVHYQDTMLDPSPGSRQDKLEKTWVKEGLAMYAELLVGEEDSDDLALLSFASQPGGSLTDFPADAELRDYGEALAFMTYLAERQGDGFIRDLVAQPEDGVLGIEATLQERGAFDPRFAPLFDDWVLASFLDSVPGAPDPFSYASLDLALQGDAVAPPFPRAAGSSVQAFGARYLVLPASDPLVPLVALVDGDQDNAPLRASLMSWHSSGSPAPVITPLSLNARTAGGSAGTPVGYDRHALVVWARGVEGVPAAYSFRYSLALEPAEVPWFLDVDSSHPFFAYISFLAARGAVSGKEVPADSGLLYFLPGSDVLRAQAAKLMVEAAGLHTALLNGPPGGTFPDVPWEGVPYPYDYVEEAVEAGIVQGFADGSFRPYGLVNRLQLVLMVYRAAAAAGHPLPPYLGGPGVFADITPADPSYAQVMAAYQAGIMSGREKQGSTYLDPWEAATKAHVAKMTANLISHLEE